MSYAERIKPDHKVDLTNLDPDDHGGLTKEEAEEKLAKLGKEMEDLQELLFAARKHSLLVVFQGRDTSGKDGAIRGILKAVNIQSCRVVPFKAPTAAELDHDFLWRVHPHVPGKGEVALFNRSHYEDVLVAKVHKLVSKDVLKARYEHINGFEKLLTDSNTIVVKFFLHISKKEQKERLLAREQDTTKAWKLAVGDWKERELWSEYKDAFETAIGKCSTEAAPWYVVPANHKWFRDLAIAEAIVEALKPYRDEWMEGLAEEGAKAKAELDAYRAKDNSKATKS